MTDTRAHTDVALLLEALRDGDREALNELYARVYTELRVLARRQRQRWEETGTLNTTALVHEAYLKLVNQRRLHPSTP
jgi:DNA-directed RNA polymerase specialized sigma24 family protein